MIVNEDVILEIVRPGTGDPVSEGEVGEIVVTSFNMHHPMIRLALGDLSAFLPGGSPCGRTGLRIKGWMGRADQTAKVKGMFVRPEQIAEIGKRHPELKKLRLVITRANDQDMMTLRAEATDCNDAFVAALGESVKAITKLSGKIELVVPGSLPNDGKVIADERPVG
jgi:phenylacetate-CoA ligase